MNSSPGNDNFLQGTGNFVVGGQVSVALAIMERHELVPTLQTEPGVRLHLEFGVTELTNLKDALKAIKREDGLNGHVIDQVRRDNGCFALVPASRYGLRWQGMSEDHRHYDNPVGDDYRVVVSMPANTSIDDADLLRGLTGPIDWR